MTSLEWANAPWNECEPTFEMCPECNGDGGVWYDDKDGVEYSVADYERLSDEVRKELKFDKCERCDGTGRVEVEPYTPDYEKDE